MALVQTVEELNQDQEMGENKANRGLNRISLKAKPAVMSLEK